VNPNTLEKDILKFSKKYICFNALHGSFGEDGKIQKILKNNKFCFTHSNYISSANCFNKSISKNIVKKFKVITPSFEIVKCGF
jgi:D-alanine-D-alanine ligase